MDRSRFRFGKKIPRVKRVVYTGSSKRTDFKERSLKTAVQQETIDGQHVLQCEASAATGKMGKSRAEIQKAYRERLKQKNAEQYLRRERERMRRNYIPSNELSENDKNIRNERNRVKLRRFLQRKREERQRQTPADHETSGYESGDAERGRLKVRLNFSSNRRKGALKRWKRELSQKNYRIKQLEEERALIERKLKSTQRSMQRMKNKQSAKITTNIPSPCANTPNKQTDAIMKTANLRPDQQQKIRKQLLLGNVLLSEIRSAKQQTKKSCVKAIHRIVSGKIVRKYRCADMLRKNTGMCRHRLGRSSSKHHQVVRATRNSKTKQHRDLIVNFMRREDNSRMQPGKQDAKKIERGERTQTFVLSDYLTNLYAKFKSEHPTVNISFTSFCRTRPKYILTTAFSQRRSCLCTKHQNAALILKALRRIGVDVTSNPEKALDQLPSDDIIREHVTNDEIKLSQWTRTEVEEKGKKKFVTKLIESTITTEAFITKFNAQMPEFNQHVTRVRTQYEQLRTLKQNLPPHGMILQLDFAENYSCKSVEEVQSAYFNQTTVTLHPMVAYYRSEEGKLEHKSYIIVSDEMGHKSSTVLTFISEIIPLLKNIDNQLSVIHYWSDSPTSQYRNKTIFDLIANHADLYSVRARWNYFEAGHGKGPCDGLGGTCKRLADEAMRSGKVIIQDARGFYDWAIHSSMTNVMFRFVSSERCAQTESAQELKHVKAIKGTMKVHAVVGLGNSTIKLRDVSCYCETCLSESLCNNWGEMVSTSNNTGQNLINTEHSTAETPDMVTEEASVHCTTGIAEAADMISEEAIIDCTTGDKVAAIYDGKWYIGEVVDLDSDDNEIEINFLETKKQLYQWPRRSDKLWISKDAVLCKVLSLEATVKRKECIN